MWQHKINLLIQMKNNMTSDFDDGDKGKVEKEDSAYFTQFENVINEIKSQLHTTNPAELARLNSAISILLASDLPAKILKSLKSLQAAVDKEEQRAEQNRLSDQEERSRDAEAARLMEERIASLEREAKEAEQHQAFKNQNTNFLAEEEKRIAKTRDITNRIQRGDDIPQEELEQLLKSDDQRKADQVHCKAMLQYQKEINDRHTKSGTEVKKWNEAIKSPKSLDADKKIAQQNLAKAEARHEKNTLIKKEVDEHKKALDDIKKRKRTEDNKFLEQIENVPNTDPRKPKLTKFAQRMKEQHKEEDKNLGIMQEAQEIGNKYRANFELTARGSVGTPPLHKGSSKGTGRE
ncbi:hypothetical protein [Candidatus Tisiphia endosymbiont of Dioctria rufipes]|uniref:hypothetical protein n=1 Tax=Candidatus Tisiphia endosymbiont of Dioctria rufipes TaxID=3066255 RepID=UPI00312CB9CA